MVTMRVPIEQQSLLNRQKFHFSSLWVQAAWRTQALLSRAKAHWIAVQDSVYQKQLAGYTDDELERYVSLESIRLCQQGAGTAYLGDENLGYDPTQVWPYWAWRFDYINAEEDDGRHYYNMWLGFNRSTKAVRLCFGRQNLSGEVTWDPLMVDPTDVFQQAAAMDNVVKRFVYGPRSLELMIATCDSDEVAWEHNYLKALNAERVMLRDQVAAVWTLRALMTRPSLNTVNSTSDFNWALYDTQNLKNNYFRVLDTVIV